MNEQSYWKKTWDLAHKNVEWLNVQYTSEFFVQRFTVRHIADCQRCYDLCTRRYEHYKVKFVDNGTSRYVLEVS